MHKKDKKNMLDGMTGQISSFNPEIYCQSNENLRSPNTKNGTYLPNNNQLNNDSDIINKCNHDDLYEGKNNFCKECGIYVIPNIETYREPNFEHRTGVNANLEYNLMIKKQVNNRFFNPKSVSLNYRDPLIIYIRSKSNEFKFMSITTYCAISYMDAVLS